MKRTSLLLVSVLTSLLHGCPTTPPVVVPDAGSEPDAGPGTDAPVVGTDAPVLSSCESVRTVTLAATGTTTATGDTTGRSSTPAQACAPMAAPREVIEITLPGPATELTGLRFSLQQAGTPENFDTIVEVREACDDETTAVCFDDAGEPRSAGTFAAAGGSTRFLVVTGYNPPTDAANLLFGPWEMVLEVVPNQHAPVLTAASALTIGDDVRVIATGTDDEGDVEAVAVTFLDAAGAVVGIDTDFDTSTPAEMELFAALRGIAPGTAFEGYATFAEIATLPAWANVASARVRVIDSFLLESNELTVTETAGTLVGLGDACDATNVCDLGYACVSALCAIPAPVVTACGAATPLAATAGAPATATVTVPAGPGIVPFADVDCTDGAPSGEALVDLTIPAGTWDVTITTAGSVTGTTDTVVYLQSSCGDPATELGCNDDVSGTDYSSLLEVADVPGGDHTLVVELYDGATEPTMVGVTVELVEVLATGATCDPSGETNRCATGVCPATGTAVCP